jgi:hypothetical protein
MNPTIKLVAAFAVGFAIPATAATGQAWKLAQDAKTKKCAVIEKRPVGAAYTIIGDNGHKTRVEMQEVTRTAEACATG